MRSATHIIQSGATAGGTQATTPNPPPPPNKSQQIRDAAQQLRDAVQSNVLQELNQARAEQAAQQAQRAAERALRNQGVTIVKTPALPAVPNGLGQGTFTIQTPEGQTVVASRPPGDNGIPPEAVDISIAFFFTVAAILILMPLARALARRMDRRSVPAQVPPEVSAQLEHLNRAVDAIALEVERISEGQRFTTKLLTDQRETAQSLTTGANR